MEPPTKTRNGLNVEAKQRAVIQRERDSALLLDLAEVLDRFQAYQVVTPTEVRALLVRIHNNVDTQ